MKPSLAVRQLPRHPEHPLLHHRRRRRSLPLKNCDLASRRDALRGVVVVDAAAAAAAIAASHYGPSHEILETGQLNCPESPFLVPYVQNGGASNAGGGGGTRICNQYRISLLAAAATAA